MSGELIDVNKIAADVATTIVTKGASRVFESMGKAVDSIRVGLRVGFDGYFSHVLRRTAHVKTLIHPDERANISDVYAPLSFKTGRKLVSDSQLAAAIRKGGKILISGTAGSGKSMFVKNITSSLLLEFDEIIPLYFELRMMKGLREGLELELLNSIQVHVPEISGEIFRSLLKRGKVALILDGYDEVDHAIRDKCGIDLMNICEMYPKAPVVITSRPEDKLSNLTTVDVYHAQPMSKYECLNLVSKFVYEQERLDEFRKAVDDHLYDKHREFLSNPLLTSMMLLTYSYHSDMPEKIHIFYQQAFETLFQRHDRSKGVFTRKILSKLPIDDFQKVVEHFSAASYAEQMFQFDERTALEILRESIQYSNVKGSAKSVLQDLIESTCTLQRDGLYLTYSHRSFQEYFAARFISSLEDDIAERAIRSLVERTTTDNTVFLLAEINRPLFERVWAIPTCERIVSSVGERLNLGDHRGAAEMLYTEIMITGGDSEPDGRGKVGFFLDGDKLPGVECMVLWRIYKSRWRPGKGHDAYLNFVEAARHDDRLLRSLTGEDRTISDLVDFIGTNGDVEGMINFPISQVSDEALAELQIGLIIEEQINAFAETLQDLKAQHRRREGAGRMFN